MPKHYKVINPTMEGYNGIIKDLGPSPDGNRNGEYVKAGRDAGRRPKGYRTRFDPRNKDRYKEIVPMNVEEEKPVPKTVPIVNGAATWTATGNWITYNATTF